MAKKISDFAVSIKSEDVVYTNFNTSKNGYNSARIVANVPGEKSFLSVGIEWEGNKVPDFVMEMMMFVKNSGTATAGVWAGKEKDYEEYSKTLDK
jgi:hypothetical protein